MHGVLLPPDGKAQKTSAFSNFQIENRKKASHFVVSGHKTLKRAAFVDLHNQNTGTSCFLNCGKKIWAPRLGHNKAEEK
jgi:hypothetical protein